MTDINVPALPTPPAAETRGERWLKYGGNVLLTTVIVLILTGIIVWAGQKYHKRANLSGNQNVKLKPQTVKIVAELDKPIRLVGLYARLKPEGAAANQQDFYQPVYDVLDEYRRANGKEIQVQMIDPVTEPAKLDAWLTHIIEKYGGDVAGHRQFLSEFPVSLKDIKQKSDAELQKIQEMVKQLKEAKFTDREQAQTLNEAISTVVARSRP